MTWHLKDRELEKKLIAIDPRFHERLCKVCENLDTNKDGDFPWYLDCSVALRHNSKRIGELVFHSDDVEKKTTEYNPHDWNEYPKVTPPFDKLMRLEFDEVRTNRKLHYAAYYTTDGWRNAVENGLPIYVLNKAIVESGEIRNVHFRPWEDDVTMSLDEADNVIGMLMSLEDYVDDGYKRDFIFEYRHALAERYKAALKRD